MTIEKLSVWFGADYSDFENGLRHVQKRMGEVSDRMEQLGEKLEQVGKKMTAAVTLPLIGLGAAAIKTASHIEEMRGKFDVVFGELAAQTEAWAASHAAAVGRSKYDLMGYAAQLQDTFVPLGFARDQAAVLSRSLTQLAIDLASFNNQAEPETVNLLTSALVGNHEAVSRFGVRITEATLGQELFRMGITGGTRAATEQQKAMARLNLIVASTRDAQGDAARTADSFANKARALSARLTDLGSTFGNILLPYAASVTDSLAGLANWLDNLSPTVQRITVALATFAAALGPTILLAGSLTKSVSTLLPVLGFLGTKFIQIGRILTGLVVSSGPVGWTIAAIAALAAGAYLLYENWDKVTAWWEKMWEEIKLAFFQASKLILEKLNTVFGAIPGLGGLIESAFTKLDGAIAETESTLAKLNAEAQDSKDDFEQAGSAGESAMEKIATAAEAAQRPVAHLVRQFEKIEHIIQRAAAAALGIKGFGPDGNNGDQLTRTKDALGREQLGLPEEAELRLPRWDEALEKTAERMRAAGEKVKYVMLDLSQAINDGLANSLSTFGEALGQFAAGTATLGDVGRVVLSSLLDLAIRVGRIAVGVGLAVAGIRDALTKLNPVVAIAAGTALIAVASAAKSALAATANGGGASSSGSAAGYQSPFSPASERLQIEIVPRVLPGGDLAFAVAETRRRRGR